MGVTKGEVTRAVSSGGTLAQSVGLDSCRPFVYGDRGVWAPLTVGGGGGVVICFRGQGSW